MSIFCNSMAWGMLSAIITGGAKIMMIWFMRTKSSSVARLASTQPAHPDSNPYLEVISHGGADFKLDYHSSVHSQGESYPT
jgi:hypothetical protein